MNLLAPRALIPGGVVRASEISALDRARSQIQRHATERLQTLMFSFATTIVFL